MSEWGVTSDDVYGAIALINFAELRFKIALTRDFAAELDRPALFRR